MTTFQVTAPCGVEKDGIKSKAEAEEAVETHEALCEDCEQGSATISKESSDASKEATEAAKADGGKTEVVDTPDQDPREPEPAEEYDLPDDGPSVDEDPLVWMPDEFTDTVDGTVTINRKGFEVLAHHYDVSGGTDMVVSPVDTDMEYAAHKATVTDADGNKYTAYGEAHATDNGEENIVRMSDTRAYKRAVSRATGVGTIAIEELQNDL